MLWDGPPSCVTARCTRVAMEPLARNALDCACRRPSRRLQLRSVGACVRAGVAASSSASPMQGRGSRGNAPASAAPAALSRGLMRRVWVDGDNMICNSVPTRGFKDSVSGRQEPDDGLGLEPFEFSVLRVSEAGFWYDSLPPAAGARQSRTGTFGQAPAAGVASPCGLCQQGTDRSTIEPRAPA